MTDHAHYISPTGVTRPTPSERMLVESWTDDEWLAVLDTCPPDADLTAGIDLINERRRLARVDGAPSPPDPASSGTIDPGPRPDTEA